LGIGPHSSSFSFFYLLFFLAYSQPSQIECLPYFYTWCGLSANLGCRSEMCCTCLAVIQDAKVAKNSPYMGTIAQLCRAISSQPCHVSTTEKTLLNSNTSFTCPHNMVNFGLLTAEIGSGVWASLQISTGFASLAALLHGKASAKLCGVEQSAPPIFGRAAITLGMAHC